MDASLPAPVASAMRTLGVARDGLSALEAALAMGEPQGLGRAFAEAVSMMSAAPGRIIVTGMGKSGLVARKIAATLASTGTPAFFVHAAEASHGDCGDEIGEGAPTTNVSRHDRRQAENAAANDGIDD